jgi:hypothetical protein
MTEIITYFVVLPVARRDDGTIICDESVAIECRGRSSRPTRCADGALTSLFWCGFLCSTAAPASTAALTCKVLQFLASLPGLMLKDRIDEMAPACIDCLR